MLQVYRKGNTDFSMNGDIQPDAISAESDIKLNAEWEMTVKFPSSQEYAEIITDDAVVKVKAPEFEEDQLWYIYKTEKDDDEITAYLRPVFFQSADDCILLDVRPTLKNGQEALEIMCAPNAKYSGKSDIPAVTTAYYYHKNLLEAIQGDDENSFLNRWGGEVLYNNYEVIVNGRVGGDYGARAEMGYNINGVEETTDTQDVITRIFPVGFNGRMLTGTSYIDSPNIGKYPFIHARFISYEDVKYVEDVENAEEREEAFQTIETFEAELRRRVQLEYAAGVDLPKITYVVDFVELSQTTEYKDLKNLISVGFGDTVKVRHRTLGIDTIARCIERKYDHVSGRVTEIVLGDFSSGYLEKMDSIVAAAGNVIDVKNNTVMADRVAGILNAMNTQLRYQKNISQTADVRAVLFEDRIAESPTYGAMCMGTQGLQIAKERTEDDKDWKWTTAITADGVNALAVVTGILSDKTGKNYWNLDTGEFRLSQETAVNGLTDGGVYKGIYMENGTLYVNASYVKSGELTLGGANNGYGRMKIYDDLNEEIGKWDKNGIDIQKGTIKIRGEEKSIEIDSGTMELFYGDEYLGYTGGIRWGEDREKKGITFALEEKGAFMAWAAQNTDEDQAYYVRLLYANEAFDNFKAKTLNLGCDLDGKGHCIENITLENITLDGEIKFGFTSQVKVYSDIEFVLGDVIDLNIKNLVGINGKLPWSGSVPVVTKIVSNGDGTITWYTSSLTVEDGIIVSAPSA